MEVTCYDIKRSKQGKVELLKQKCVKTEDVYDTPAKVAEFIINKLNVKDFFEERPHIIALNTSGKVQGVFQVGQGGITQCVVDIRQVFLRLITINATAFIFTHNHPGGSISPSDEDIKMTRRLLKAGKILNIELLDHIITGEDEYFSFKNNGLLKEENE